jgi:hypothetical protein
MPSPGGFKGFIPSIPMLVIFNLNGSISFIDTFLE